MERKKVVVAVVQLVGVCNEKGENRGRGGNTSDMSSVFSCQGVCRRLLIDCIACAGIDMLLVTGLRWMFVHTCHDAEPPNATHDFFVTPTHLLSVRDSFWLHLAGHVYLVL